MKYIRTKDKVLDTTNGIYDKKYDEWFIGFYIIYRDDIIKQADTIDELFDMYILVQDNGAYTPMNKNEAIDELALGKRALYGMIWAKGEHDEPILKAVAKLNDKGEWKLI